MVGAAVVVGAALVVVVGPTTTAAVDATADQPPGPIACTCTDTLVPLVSPVMVHDVVGAVDVQLLAPAVAM